MAEEMKRAYHFDWLSWTFSWTVPRNLSFLMVRRNLDSKWEDNLHTSSMGTREVYLQAPAVTLRKSWIISAA